MLESFTQNINSAGTAEFAFFLLFPGVLFGLSVATAFRYLIRARTLEDIPTSKARSAEQGYVELEGHAEMLGGEKIISPLSGRECVWWSYTIEKRSDDKWRVVKKATSDSLFGLRDATGLCLVDPEGAEVFPEHSRKWRGKSSLRPSSLSLDFGTSEHRFKEHYFFAHEKICVIGLFRTHTAVDNWDDTEEIRQMLIRWKRDQPELLARFDTNGDGIIDQTEWNIARETARQAVLTDKHELSVQPGVNVIGAPNDRRPFLMAPLDNSDFAKKLRIKAMWASLAMVLTGLFVTFILATRIAA